MKFLIFANGDAEEGVMVHRALSESDGAHVIGVDGGTRNAWAYDKQPHTVIGDLDSLSEEEAQKAAQAGAQIFRYSPEKDKTDLELALIYAAEQGATWIRVIGAMGRRFDQMLANVYLLGLPILHDCDIAIVAGRQILTLRHPDTHHLFGKVGDTISLIPLSGDVQGIYTEGLQYPLKNETLVMGPARGVSNVLQAEEAVVRFESGLLLCVQTDGRA